MLGMFAERPSVLFKDFIQEALDTESLFEVCWIVLPCTVDLHSLCAELM